MKGSILDSLAVCGVVVISLLTFNGTSAITHYIPETSIIKTDTVKVKVIKNKVDSINLDSLILDTKQTIRLFNKTELEKQATNKKEIVLIKKKLILDKEQNAITREIIVKLKKKILETRNKEIVLQADSICVENNRGLNRVFHGKKCNKYDVTYFVIVNDKRYNLNKD